jgi:rhodanese-related sulfurtransferase
VNAHIEPEELMRQIREGKAPVIVDVRSRTEFEAGHLPGAVHLPFWKAGRAWRSIEAARESPVVVYCGHGPRAHIAGAALRRHGFGKIAYLAGHMKKWKDMNLPVEGR